MDHLRSLSYTGTDWGVNSDGHPEDVDRGARNPGAERCPDVRSGRPVAGLDGYDRHCAGTALRLQW